jgi:tetraacyldisaccharide 4'-kinase
MEAQFRRVVSGESTRFGAHILRLMLALIAIPYRAAVAVRNALYDAGLLQAHRAGVPVVSVGNITLGGTGKTPFVELICRWFLARQKRPVILSRGYRAAGAHNDEAISLRARLPDVPHMQGKDRVALARHACTPGSPNQLPDVLILDDGFQHRRLARDLDIVLIDCTEPFGYGRIFPRGALREPIDGLRRADLIVLSRVDCCSSEELQRIIRRIAMATADTPIIGARHRPTALRSANHHTVHLSALQGRTVAAFCGIGNPNAFAQTIRRLGCKVLDVRTFPDHHAYTSDDLAELADWGSRLGCEWIVTTQKDLVKIPHVELGGRPVFALEIETVLDDPHGHLDQALSSRVPSGDDASRQAA